MSLCVRYIEEIRLYLKVENFESAQIRASDLTSLLIQIQEISKNSNQLHQIDFVEVLLEIEKIRAILRKKVDKDSFKISKIRLNSQLDIISNNLNKLIGKIKISIQKGEKDG